ncbi:phage portal protein [Methylobacterium oxalidis]|uniref:phage portal protein n=1 Tax=Methylobacterium oxalidis TaxID=944322 RepID=UPI003315EC36
MPAKTDTFPVTATFGAAPVETKAATVPAVSGVSSPEQWLLDWGSTPSIAGPAVTPASAMGVPAVASAVTLISGALGALPCKVYRESTGGGREEAPDHPAFDLLNDHANDWTPAGKLREQLVVDALLKGNGYGLVIRDSDGTPVEIHRLPPEAVSIVVNPLTSEPWFKVSTSDGQATYSHADVVHVPALCSLDGISGVAPIIRARNVIALAIALEQHAARIMSKGARPSGILTAPATKTADGAKNIQASFGIQHANENSGGLAVVYGGMTFTATEFKTVDLQFMEMRAFQIHEIAKVFNVPPTLIGELAKATLSNSETMGRQFLTMTLMPWIKTFQGAFRRTLISRADRKTYTVDFTVDGLLQADSAARAAFYAALRAAGCVTANEVRALENLPAHPDGNSLASPHTTANAAPALEPADV